ncbi:MAG: hypothetical protein QGH99_13180, partial [Pseudomonadales bacterium]|nr:hypothetical protein [Pseudomonadales bacterium]
LAEHVGGRLTVANRVLPPMVIPDERASEADRATDLLVITWYPTKEVGESALAADTNKGVNGSVLDVTSTPLNRF